MRVFRLAPLVAVLLAGLAMPAWAACPITPATRGSCGATIGTGAATVVNAAGTGAAGGAYRLVVIDNESLSATIACTDDGSTPALNTAGSWTIGPGVTRTWAAANTFFTGPFQCISNTASTPATVRAE